MLYPQKLARALEADRERFLYLMQRPQDDRHAYQTVLGKLRGMGAAELEDRLADVKSPGALPSEEYGRIADLVLPFGQSWSNHAEAQAWALEHIADVTTLAVDGSEIVPSRYYSQALGAVQVGWFENSHRAGWLSGFSGGRSLQEAVPYAKDVSLELVYTAEVGEKRGRGYGVVDEEIKLRRFVKEIDTMIERLATYSFQDNLPVVFFDGTLVVSFAAALPERARRDHVVAVLRLLRASEDHRVPVIGYIDASDASDLVTMLSHAFNMPAPQTISDGYLLAPMLSWGDRTKAFICARDDILQHYYDAESERSYRREIAFCYLKASSFGTLARLEFPRWVLREGLLDYVADVVRAEIVPSGHGYPYCLEAAHEVATLRAEDRESFFAACQRFAARHGVEMSLPPKAVSKRIRRF